MKTLEGEKDEGDNLSISKVQMPRQVMQMICPAIISMPGLYRLELEFNKLDHDGFASVAEILRHQLALSILALPENEIESVESARILSSAIAEHPSLEKLRLNDCGIGKNVEVLAALLHGCENIRLLDLRRNHIDSKGVNTLANFIAENHEKVDTLDLEGNSLADDDVPPLVAAVKKNTNLTVLDVTENDLTENGRVEMMKAVFDTTSVNTVVESNHDCRLVLSSSGNNHAGPMLFFLVMRDEVPFEDIMQTVNGMHEPREAKIEYKVLQALHHTSDDEMVNVQYLNDIPVKCMPRVLEIVQKKMDIGEHMLGIGAPFFIPARSWMTTPLDLSRVFHIVKGWEMPLLFDYGGSSIRPKKKGRGKRKRNNAKG